jgi:hypothetical protein
VQLTNQDPPSRDVDIFSETLPADTVVFISLNRGNREIYDELTGRVPDLRIVGDANAARQVPDAVREGHVAGATI